MKNIAPACKSKAAPRACIRNASSSRPARTTAGSKPKAARSLKASGVYYAATALEGQLCRGATVIVAGAGNSAGQAAMYLSEGAAKVLLVVRGNDLRKSMSNYLSRRVEACHNIEILYRTEIRKMIGGKMLEKVELENIETRRTPRWSRPPRSFP